MNFRELDQWFAEKCDGDWEHQGGVIIESTDNPGWHVKIIFDDIDIPASIEERNIRKSDEDYFIVRIDKSDNSLNVACGLGKLEEAMQIAMSRGQ